MKNFIKFIFLIAGLLAGSAQAAVCTTNAGTGTWGTNSTWSCGHVPLSTDTVVISRNITLNANDTIAGLTVNAGVTFSGNNRNLTVSGPVLISGIYNTGGGDLTTTGGGSLTVNVGGIFNFNNGNAQINGNVAINGTLTSGGDNMRLTGVGTTLSGTGNIVDTTLEIDATGVSVPVGANLVFDANSEIDVGANNPGSLTINGTIDGTAQGTGDRIIRVSDGGTLTVASTGFINAPNSELNVRDGATATNNGTITIRDIISRNRTPTPVFTQGSNSTLNVSGTICATACTFNASAAGNTVNYTGAAQTVYSPSGSTYANLTLSGSGATTVPTGLTVAGNFTMSGTATTTAPAALAVGGDFIIGAGNTFAPGTGTVTLNGAATQTISSPNPVNFNNLTIANGASPNITLATNVTVAGTLTGTVTLTSTCPTDYTLTSNGGATIAHSCSSPSISSINLADPDPTVATSVSWTVTFNTSVTGVSSGNFTLVNSGLGGAPAITSVTGSGTTWTVTASTGTGTGTLGLDMTDATGVTPALTNLPFTGQVYTLDRTAPVVSSIVRGDPTPTALASVSWTVTFGESVTGVDATDFALAQAGGVSGAFITAVTPVSGTIYTVTASTGTGNGTLGLNLADNDSIIDAVSNPLGGAGAGNGDFSGETYSMVRPVTVTASPTACLNVAGIGTRPWGTLTGPLASDNAYATASVNDNKTTNYLQCTGYGFAIPAGATINGITVNVERRTSGNPVRDAAMRLVRDVAGVATIQATDRSTLTNYTTADVIEAHGGAADLWGATWTAADINSGNFGAALASIKAGPAGGARTVSVDHISISIDYTVPTPLAEYRMDEASWNGTANEVADSSGNALHGSAQLGATPAAAKICNGANLAANYVEVPDNALLDITGTLTVTAWIKPARWGGAPGKDALMTFLSKDTNYEAHINSTGNVNWWWGTGSITSAATAPIGAWTHVAMVYASGSQTLYINGVASGTGTVAGALPVNALPFQIGDDQAFGGGTRRFDGMIDEVKVFNAALTAPQISAGYANENAGTNWDGSARVCPTYGPDHLEIQHASGTGLTCTASTLTIKACTDTAVPCVTPYTLGVSGTLSAMGAPTVNWDGTTGGAAGAGFVIPNGSSSVTKDVQVTTPGSLVFGVSTANPAPMAATACDFGAPSCTFTSADAGFLVSAPDHVAESASTLTVQAVKKADNSLQCVPAFASVPKTVNLKCAYVNPASGTLPVRVGGTALNAGNNAAAACDGSGANVPLNFDASGIATPSLQYADVGEMQINAAFTGAVGSLDAGLSMTGSGNFIAAPASFSITGITAGQIKADNDFSATITALNAAGNAAPNFGQESAAEGVTLTSVLVSPLGGANPVLANGSVAGGAFTNGAATVANLSWGEVGNITLDAALTSASYLGSGLNAIGTSAAVGPFIPDHFDTAVVPTATLPMPCPAGLTCPALYDGIVYSGQPFSVQVTALNLSDGTTTNYDGTFGFSKATTLTAWDAKGGATQNPGSGVLGSNAVAAAAFVSGVATLTDTPTYTFDTTPTAPTDVYVRAVDADGVTSFRTAFPGLSVEGGIKVVSGRIKVPNAYGSNLLPLTLTATAQYYTASGWVTSITDSVTSLTLAANYDVVKNGSPTGTTTPAPTGVTTLNNGQRAIVLGKPTGGASGVATINPGAPAYLPVIPGTATFGIYKGNNEFIYLRESY